MVLNSISGILKEGREIKPSEILTCVLPKFFLFLPNLNIYKISAGLVVILIFQLLTDSFSLLIKASIRKIMKITKIIAGGFQRFSPDPPLREKKG